MVWVGFDVTLCFHLIFFIIIFFFLVLLFLVHDGYFEKVLLEEGALHFGKAFRKAICLKYNPFNLVAVKDF